MTSTVTLPAAAIANMSPQAGEQLAENAPHVVPPSVNVITSTSADETLIGTDGPDVFVFDGSTPQGSDTIMNYDVTEDRIEFYFADKSAVGLDASADGQTTFLYPNGQVTVDESYANLAASDTVSFFYPSGEIIL